MSLFYCIRCNRDKDEGCGQPNRKVPVPFESGIRMMTPACPYTYKNLFWRTLARLGIYWR